MHTRWFFSCLVLLLLLIVLLMPARIQAQKDKGRDGEEAGVATVLAASGALRSRGPAISLPVQVINVQRLGAATVLVPYDPALVKPTACQRSTLFDVGLCNLSYDRNGDGKPEAVLFNAVSLGGVNAGATPVTLASISWQAPPPTIAPVSTAITITLGIEVQTFTDVDAKPLEHAEQAGQLTILPPMPRLHLPFIRR